MCIITLHNFCRNLERSLVSRRRRWWLRPAGSWPTSTSCPSGSSSRWQPTGRARERSSSKLKLKQSSENRFDESSEWTRNGPQATKILHHSSHLQIKFNSTFFNEKRTYEKKIISFFNSSFFFNNYPPCFWLTLMLLINPAASSTWLFQSLKMNISDLLKDLPSRNKENFTRIDLESQHR